MQWVSIVGGALLLLAALAVLVVVATGESGTAGREYQVVIPAGTGARIDAGEPVELIPANLELDVHTTFVVRNDDARLHEVGPFAVRAGEVITYDFDEPGVYQGSCTVHPSGTVKITIS